MDCLIIPVNVAVGDIFVLNDDLSTRLTFINSNEDELQDEYLEAYKNTCMELYDAVENSDQTYKHRV